MINSFNWIENEYVVNTEVYERYINWVSGEFDLYQKYYESRELKVYFPSGWFVIRHLYEGNKEIGVEIKVEGKSKLICQKISRKLKSIFFHVKKFQDLKTIYK